MKVRFLADADLNEGIVIGALRRQPSLDFLTAQSAGLRKLDIPEALTLAVAQRRVLVSHDVCTMPTHFLPFRNGGEQSSGVILILQRLEVGTAIEELRSPDKPAWTIQGRRSDNMGPSHWRNRILRISEIQRLQSFPDEYIIAGNVESAWRQIGNAAPPKLAQVLGTQIARDPSHKDRK